MALERSANIRPDARRWMLYGATGYTGRLICRDARSRGLEPLLAARERRSLEELGRELGFETRCFDLEDPQRIAEQLNGIYVVLNCAGPFLTTSKAMLAGCVRSGTHYLDITAQVDVLDDVLSRSAEWQSAGILAMSGVGFDIVVFDCLAAMLKTAMPDATQLRLAFTSYPALLSPGVAKTMVEGFANGGRVRRDGKITIVPTGYKIRKFDFRDTFEAAVTIPWGDVASAYYSTGIPNIETYLGMPMAQAWLMKPIGWLRPLFALPSVQAALKRLVEKTVKGPSEDQLRRAEMLIHGEVSNAEGRKIVMKLRTPDGYVVTIDSALAIVDRVLRGPVPSGASTPSKAFGADFVFALKGIERGHLESFAK
jgi:short subunit dehydrogenase-like uncharacterized protein